jgi:hypothetical protein
LAKKEEEEQAQLNAYKALVTAQVQHPMEAHESMEDILGTACPNAGTTVADETTPRTAANGTNGQHVHPFDTLGHHPTNINVPNPLPLPTLERSISDTAPALTTQRPMRVDLSSVKACDGRKAHDVRNWVVDLEHMFELGGVPH